VTKHVLLNNNDHRDLKIVTSHGAAYGDDVMYSVTFPAEFRSIQAYYPIVFGKGKDGSFTPLALFGFREKQNLFLQGDHWDALYRPMMIERIPFLIGMSGANKVIHVDLDHPRVSRTAGEPLFLEHGGNTPLLERVSGLLGAIGDGIELNGPFTKALEEHELLESFVLDIEFRDGAQHRFAGFYAVQEEKLTKLPAEALAKLHERGFLQSIYMVIASLAHFRDLIERASKLNAADR
jgi:hypothetical protein